MTTSFLLLFCFLGLFSTIQAQIPRLQLPFKLEAHRGAGHLEPENTLQAFNRAIELGLDSVETDVLLTKDKVPVLVHGMMGRFAGYVEFSFGLRNISKFTLEKIKTLTLANGQKIITLAEALDVCKDKIQLNIELKDFREEVVERVLDVVEEKGMLGQITFSSFHHSLRRRLTMETERRRIAPISFGYLSHVYDPRFPNYRMTQPGDTINVDIRYLQLFRRATLTQIFAARARGVMTKIWFPMVFESEIPFYEDLIELGVDYIITNEPILALNYLNNKGVSKNEHGGIIKSI